MRRTYFYCALTWVAAATCSAVAEVSFEPHIVSLAANDANSVWAADLDEDGDVDLLSASKRDNKIAWYENMGGVAPVFIERVVTTAAMAATSVSASDINDDGHLDVLSASDDDNSVVWYESDGGTPPAFFPRVISQDALGARAVCAADMDGDGDIDVVSASHDDDKIAWYENDGGVTPIFTEWVISGDPDGNGPLQGSVQGPRCVFAADVDGDLDVDVVTGSSQDHFVVWYENDGSTDPVFVEHVVETGVMNVMSVYAADIDGDGDIDLLSGAQQGITVAWYENSGGSPPEFETHVLASALTEAHSIGAWDLNGDTHADVVTAESRSDVIRWYENNGTEPVSFTPRVVAATTDGPKSVYSADVNGDGHPDIVSASSNDATVSWFESDGGVPLCPGDLDDDGDTDVLDFAIFVTDFGCPD